MTKHFHNEIEILKKKILNLAARVEKHLQMAINSIIDSDIKLADEVIDLDPQIDAQEVEVEEDCLKILALHQPVAADLRYVIAVMKINNDLERIADMAVNIAKRSKTLARKPNIIMPFDIHQMLEITVKMVQDSVDALVSNDTQKARQVCLDDDQVDELHKQAYSTIIEQIKENPEMTLYYVSTLNVSRNLERIADHATNIAEDVIYMIEGEIVRHRNGI